MAADPPAKAARQVPVAASQVEKAVKQDENKNDENKNKGEKLPGVTKPPLTPEQKQKVMALTSMLVVGVVTAILLLFLWILWWSRRTHRLLREPLPVANRGDELWYLKTKRPPSPGSATDPPAAERPPAPPTP